MYQICISGASKGESLNDGHKAAIELGKAMAKGGHTLLTGATNGLPNAAAAAYKDAGGTMSLGISPAATRIEHVMKYHLPTKEYDAILFTGLHYVGRDALLVTSSDAVISIGGRIGTLHEFTIAIESKTPVGFVDETGGISQEINKIIDLAGHPHTSYVTFNSSPVGVLNSIIEHLDKERSRYQNLYR